jgi:hypothetical protein
MKNEWKIGWKVVRKYGNRYESAAKNGHTCKYWFSKITKPRHGDGPLAIFAAREDARANGPLRAIFKCQYLKSNAQELWYKHNGYNHYSRISLPNGTRFASAVKLLRVRG